MSADAAKRDQGFAGATFSYGRGTAGFAPYLERPEVLLVRGLHAHARGDYAGFDSAAQRARLLDALLLFSGARIDSLELRHLDSTAQARCRPPGTSASKTDNGGSHVPRAE